MLIILHLRCASIIAAMTFDLQPHLIGELVELRPLRAEDWPALFDVASDPLIWEQHPAKDRCKEDVFRKFFAKALDEVNCAGGAFAVIDKTTGSIIGSTRFANLDPDKSEVEIGWTFLASSHWGGRYNGEMKQLMLDHAFQSVQSVYFLIGPDNIRSQKAVERIGATRNGMVEKPDSNGLLTRNIRYFINKPR
jgi:RimJ/RimL family protein N-acetyltransferase